LKLRFAIPLLVLAGLIALFAVGLQRDPRLVPSPLIGKPAPAFDLPTLDGTRPRMSEHDLRGAPVLVNFFASWCAGCQEEHPMLLQLARSGAVRIVGVDYKDTEEAGRDWLQQRGNPYAQVVSDADGRTGIDWGVYGVPETFVLDAQGIIVYKQIGPVTAEAWEKKIRPALQAGAKAGAG
jgi:cytochrome c biogenesis protein CcmG/thiol:disulfide interchange protein DsbE